jgi:hypothetical protein
MMVLKHIWAKILESYTRIPFALYLRIGSSEDLAEDYRSRSIALCLFCAAQMANILLVCAVGWPTLWTTIVQRRSQALLVAGIAALPWSLWLNGRIDKKRKENEAADLQPFEGGRRDYLIAMCYVAGSIVAAVLALRLAVARRQGR